MVIQTGLDDFRKWHRNQIKFPLKTLLEILLNFKHKKTAKMTVLLIQIGLLYRINKKHVHRVFEKRKRVKMTVLMIQINYRRLFQSIPIKKQTFSNVWNAKNMGKKRTLKLQKDLRRL